MYGQGIILNEPEKSTIVSESKHDFGVPKSAALKSEIHEMKPMNIFPYTCMLFY